jgi:hypothetical protein
VTTLFPGTARQIGISVMWSYVNTTMSIDTWVHELCHAALNFHHLYGSNCRGFGLTVASCGSTIGSLVHLDPWNKVRLGWVKPLIYDIRDHPAGAALPPAQAAGYRPVILYDSSRDVHDYHIVEHRSGQYSVGTTTWVASGGVLNAPVRSGGYPRAGYDIDVKATNNTRKGFLTWSVKTNAAHDVLEVIQRVSPGGNGVINSVRAGDDILYPTTGTPTQIHCGPDGILQSIAIGDDGYWQDALCIAVPDPDNMLSREPAVIVPSGPAATTLRYYSNVAGAGDTGVTVRGAEASGNNFQFLEWGRSFRPFLSTVIAPAAGARPGTILAITGSLGEQRFSPELVTSTGTRIPLTVNSWTGAGGLFALPSTWVPPGNHRLVLFDGGLKEASSNSWPITVADPCQSWLTDNFSALQISLGLAAYDADPDSDDQPNLVEMIMGTNPNASNPPPWTWTLTDPYQPIVSYTVRTDRCAVKIIMEYSENLSLWIEETSQTVTPTAGASNVASGSMRGAPRVTSGKSLFRRMKIQQL